MNILLFRTIYVPVENAINIPSSFDINVGTTLGKSKVKKNLFEFKKNIFKEQSVSSKKNSKKELITESQFLSNLML